ncbi:MAG: NifB/NifX family molybdenum-iron cluster-binding protein [Spirochaetales bacterium]|uniref:NifB/NifX family molybdenum-iron cluster-binding protein n=1 Tax=Candidatus Thalassospirochaeta sargassi TaxID=3119039 RepID=A0AAJ1MPY8_9SPIO|nr:NifB/NifX family molybdenum-iron cluster-binding protein [Spirochaetales bacterium]
MKIVLTAKGEDWDAQIDPRFGRADFLFMYDEEKDEFKTIDNTDIQNAAHGAGPQTAKKLFELAPDVLITGNGPGGNAAAVIEKANLSVFTGAQNMTLKEAYSAYKDGKLTAF